MGPDPATRPRSGRTAFDTAYEGTPSWEVGRPQRVVLRLLREGAFGVTVLDAGCGTGTHAVALAERGHRVVGIDLAPAAVARARARADAAGVAATFLVGDVLALDQLRLAVDEPVDTVLDVGLLHVLQPHDRRRYATALAGVTRSGGRGFVVCWSDRNPFGFGPARLTRRELRATFRAAEGWAVDSIEPDWLETLLPGGRVHAWLVRLRRR